MNKFNFNSFGNSKQTISYCEADKCPVVIKLREQREAYKMEAEEGKEINAELKAENEKLKEFQKLLEEQMKFNKSELELSLSSEIKRSEFLLKEFKKVDKQRDNWREQAEKLKQTLAEIKEIAEKYKNLTFGEQQYCYSEILQKISEVE